MSQRVLARALNYMISPCLYWASPPWTAVPRWKCPSRPLPSSNLVLSEGQGNYWDKYRREGETCGKNTLIIHSLLASFEKCWDTGKLLGQIKEGHIFDYSIFILFHWIKTSHNWHKLFFHVITKLGPSLIAWLTRLMSLFVVLYFSPADEQTKDMSSA